MWKTAHPLGQGVDFISQLLRLKGQLNVFVSHCSVSPGLELPPWLFPLL